MRHWQSLCFNHFQMKTVLLVDDEPALLEAFRQALSLLRNPFILETAENGREAIETLSRGPVDLVVTDLEMPVLDGFQLIAHMRRFHPLTRVIVMTNSPYSDARSRILGLGPLTFIEKPLDLPQLIDRIRSTLEQGARGRLEGITLAGFLQLLCLEERTCSLRVSATGRNGRIDLDRGQPVHAATSRGRGIAALAEMIGWEGSVIQIDPPSFGRDRTIDKPLDRVLLETAQFQDEAVREIPVPVEETSPLEAPNSSAAPLPEEGQDAVRRADPDAAPGEDPTSPSGADEGWMLGF